MGTRNRSILIVAVAFIVGLLLGWIVLGWWLFPVQWGGTLVQDLQPADKKVFIATEAEALALTQDGAKAVERLQGPIGPAFRSARGHSGCHQQGGFGHR